MLRAGDNSWKFLGKGLVPAVAAVRTPPVNWSGSYKQLMIEYYISGYGGNAIGRVIVGTTTPSESALFMCNKIVEIVTAVPTITNAVSIPGWPTAGGTATNVARYGIMHVNNPATDVKRMTGTGQHTGVAPTATPTMVTYAGMWSNNTTQINCVSMASFSLVTGAAAPTVTFSPNTYVAVWGRND